MKIKYLMFLMVVLLSFSGFSSTFDSEDAGDKIEIVVDAETVSIQATLEVSVVTFETRIGTELGFIPMTSVTAQSGNSVTALFVDDVGWLNSIDREKQLTYADTLYRLTGHRITDMQISNYKNNTFTSIRERFKFNSFSCN